MIKDYTVTVEQQVELAPTIFELTLNGAIATAGITAGQFVNVKIPDDQYILRRPFGVAEVNETKAQIKLIYRVVGEGTEIMAKVQPDDQLKVLGPLGHGFPIDFLQPKDRVLIVGGGTGLPPLYELGRRLQQKQVQMEMALGFPTRERVFYEHEFAAFGETYVSTDDGTYGIQGTIIDLLNQKFKAHEYQAIYACGPRGLEIAVSNYFAGHPNAYISAEARMACGIGICNACVLHTKADPNGPSEKKVCVDGPVFHIDEVLL
ncbi:dihydroorotate dehydrogenase electron transfer subunit [Agrilactobacillus fermenti]|uniref:dihydroorotate dehydrogenase electron transfer subunit n=1 Tax=Agrilactobacillus fermenti TaxID=2586909 RepID=UPI001E2B75AA|nr:dihydroorotate dehydrogenase electron transfer subunit [Agrilactobacillus fermenti]MCD2256582.1 dihydroorotate dehydrogenase electron transfer subunit [Agrilactobacillus fermenti]